VHLVPLAQRRRLAGDGHRVQRQVGQQLAQVAHQDVQLALRAQELEERLARLGDVQRKGPAARLVLAQQVERQVGVDGAVVCGAAAARRVGGAADKAGRAASAACRCVIVRACCGMGRARRAPRAGAPARH
jgi:hypothetical protein